MIYGTVIFIKTINLWLSAPAVGLYSLNILHQDMLHQPNRKQWNSICCKKWCTKCSRKPTQISCGSDTSQKALNHLKLTELKQSSRVRCSADVRMYVCVHMGVYLQSSVSHMSLPTCGRMFFFSVCATAVLSRCTRAHG